MMQPNFADWYWSKPDGTTFSSAQFATVPADDPGLAAWKAIHGEPGLWPDDLADVLARYGLSMTGPIRSVAAYTLLMAIPLDKRDLYGSAVKGWDQRRMSARGSDLIPETSPLIARIAPLISLTPKAWFDLALGVVPS